MPLKDKYSHVKDRVKRRLGVGSANTASTVAPNQTQPTDHGSQSTSSTPGVVPASQNPVTKPPTPGLLHEPGGVPSNPTSQLTKTAPWSGLHKLLRAIESTSGVFAPLSSAVGGLSDCLSASKGRKDYEELRTKLDALLGDLSECFAHSSGPKMTASMRNLSIGLEQEVKLVERKYARDTVRTHTEALGDLEEIIASYRRIQGHIERLTLNANLNLWETVNNLEAEARLRDLSPARSAVYNSAKSEDVQRRACTPGTRRKELAKLLRWARNRNTNYEDVYWMNGMAGTGKTTIAYSLCAELEQSAELGASFFCSRLIPECRSVKLIIPSIAYQLARFSHPFRFALSTILEEDPDAHTRVLKVQYENLLLKPLEKIKNTLPTGFVVIIDALDECENEDSVGQILDILLSRSNHPEVPIRFLLSSRPESKIYHRMMSRVGHSFETRLVLHDLDTEAVKHDIATFLQAELSALNLTPAQLTSLVNLSGVLFIFASTAARYIIDGIEDMEHEERINTILGLSSDPTSNKDKAIDQLYESILQAVFINKKIDKSVQIRLKDILDTIICAQEPMTLEVIAGLLGEKSGNHVNALLRRLSSVLNIGESNRLVTTLHASFPDYMLNPRRSFTLCCNPARTHVRVSHTCFESIKSVNTPFNICGLESSYLKDENLPSLIERSNGTVSPHLLYACRYWMTHMELGGTPDEFEGCLLDFLSTRMLLWMEILNVKKCMNIGPGIMMRAESWSRANMYSKETIELAHDSWRFVTMFASHAVSQSTPHIYTSMLPFWPVSAPITKHYFARTQGGIQVWGTAIARRQFSLLATWTFDETVNLTCFSPDGSTIGFRIGSSLYIIDGATGATILGPLAHDGLVRSLAFSPDGTLLVSGSQDTNIRLWSTADGKSVVGPVAGHTNKVLSVCFFPSGKRIVSGSSDRTIRFWDVETGKIIATPIQAHTGPVMSVSFSPDGTRVASGSSDSTIKIWDAESGEIILGPLEGHTSLVRSVCFSPDSAHIVSGSDDRTVGIWSNLTGRPTFDLLRGHTDAVNSVAFSPDGGRTVSGSSDLAVRIWDINKLACVGVLQGHVDTILSVSFSPDGARIVSGSMDKTIRVWDAWGAKAAEEPLEGHIHGVTCVALSHDGSQIISGSNDAMVCIWNSLNGQLVVGPLQGHTHWINSVCFSPDGTQAATASEDTTILFWDTQTGAPIGLPLTGHSGGVLSVCFSPDGTLLASGSDDQTIRLWDLRSQNIPASDLLKVHKSWVSSVCFSPEGLRLFSASGDMTVIIWDVLNKRCLTSPLRGHTDEVLVVGVSPDGEKIASGSRDQTIRLWNAYNGQTVFIPLEGHSDAVTSVSFSPDGRYIVSGSSDKELRIWNAENGHAIGCPLIGHTEKVLSCVFSFNSRWIISGSFDKTIRMWEVADFTGDPEREGLEAHQDTNQLNCMKTSAPGSWSLKEDGWIVDRQHHLLAWIPPDLRHTLMYPYNPLLISVDGSFQLSFESAKLGESWVECYKY